MQYKLLILCTTLRSLFKRNKKNYERIECVRSNRADEKKKHWLFSFNPTAFSPMGGQSAHTRKKKYDYLKDISETSG